MKVWDKHFNAFENELYGMLRSVEFKHSCNVVQKKFLLVSADKSTNIYWMPIEDCNKLLTKNSGSNY